MRDEYAISIERAGVADLPELCRATDPAAAAAVIQALLASHDVQLMALHVAIVRVHAGK